MFSFFKTKIGNVFILNLWNIKNTYINEHIKRNNSITVACAFIKFNLYIGWILLCNLRMHHVFTFQIRNIQLFFHESWTFWQFIEYISLT